MTAPTFFTVSADYRPVSADADTDSDYDPQTDEALSATVTFTPVLATGDVILATDASPRPTGYVCASIAAMIDPADGRLKLRTTPDAGGSGTFAPVRLLADTALLELDTPLYYKVTFTAVTYGGKIGSISSFTFQAPTSDTELNLIDVSPAPGELASGIQKIGPGEVRLEDGDIIFSFAGVDIPDPIAFEPTFDAAEITDGTATGRALITAASAAAARTAISAAKSRTTSYDLRDDPNVLAANWTTFLGAGITSGSTTITNSTNSWTAADVGKVVMILRTNGQWFKSTITAVASASSATLANAAPVTESGKRCRYGFDGTTAINSALAAVQAQADGPVNVYLGGNYRLTQLVIPSNIILRGVAWNPTTVQQIGNSSRTTLAQLPGAECDFVIFGDYAQILGTIGPSGLIDINLWGPETNVYGVNAATTGHGVSLRVNGSDYGLAIDGFQLRNVGAYNFPQSGFRCFGAVPLYVHDCKALFNGRFGFEHQRFGGASTNALHLINFSADWNNLGAVGIRALKAYDTVFMSGLKLEGTSTAWPGDLTTFRGGSGWQTNGVVLDNCDPMSSVLINGLSHIRIVSAEIAPGPAITIKDSASAGLKPRLTFNAVSVRLHGAETGSTADAVTLRDEISSVNIPNTVTSGHYPTATAPPSLVDNTGDRFIRFNAYAGSATAFIDLYNAPNFPIIAAADSTQSNVALGLQAKGNGTVYIDSTSPSITAGASGTNRSLNLISRGTGTININGVEAVRRTAQTITTATTLGTGGDFRTFIGGASGVPTLPTAVGNTGKYTFKNLHSSTVSIATTSSQTIEGLTSWDLPPGDSIDLVSDGTVWRVI